MQQQLQQRLYFTAEKICIGSYNEVEKYEQENTQSYWASDFYQLISIYAYILPNSANRNYDFLWLESRFMQVIALLNV